MEEKNFEPEASNTDEASLRRTACTVGNSIEQEIPMIDLTSDDFKEQLEFNVWSTQSCSDYRNDRERPYNGQPWTDDGIRGMQEVKGLTMRDLKDCLIKAMLYSSPPPQEYWDRFLEFFNSPQTLKEEQEKFVFAKVELGTWRPQDVYKIDWNNIDPIAITQNFTCEVEKLMGIFPNLPKHLQNLAVSDTTEAQ